MTDDLRHRRPEIPALSIVIPSYRRTDPLLDTLRDLSEQKLQSFEVIVVVQVRPSEDEVNVIISILPHRLRLFFVSEPNASLARNIGLIEAWSELVLFLDDDVRINDKEFLRKHVDNFDDCELSGVYGQVLEREQRPTFVPDPEIIGAHNGWMHLPPNFGHRCRTRSGTSNNLAVRRAWAIAVGGMDANFTRGALREETEFSLRYTDRYGPLVFDPNASLVHLSNEGGSRTWGHVRRTVPMHHIVGQWYFLIASLCNGVLDPTAVMLELRSLAVGLLRNPRTGWNVVALLRNILRALYGLMVAIRRRVYGPRHINSIGPRSYERMA
jgi:glycosyltransferase involved in cell wall biosynthesis